MITKKRMGIFIFYDKYGIVSSYIEYLLNSMKEILEKIIIVINGSVNEEGNLIFHKYSDEVYVRQNIGYDAGALKDTFTVNLKNESWEVWDEVVIFNDTFYGPLVPWDYIFNQMDEQDIDFWGLSKWYGAKSAYDGKMIAEHIQSYFLVFSTRVITNPGFMKFWIDMDYPDAYRTAIESYEAKLTNYLKQLGFSGSTWMEKQCGDKYKGEASVVYTEHGYDLIREGQFPVIKKRAISIQNWNEARKILSYVQKNTDYDLQFILNHLKRKDDEGEIKPFSANRMKKFLLQHDKVFIYGAGRIGQAVACYLKDNGFTVQAFLVTERNDEQENVIEYKSFRPNDNDGIIIGVGRKYCREIYNMLIKDCPERNILMPEYDLSQSV